MQISSEMQVSSEALVKAAKEQGYWVIQNFLDPSLVESVRTELVHILDQDLQDRQAQGVTTIHWQNGMFPSCLNAEEHFVVFPLWQSLQLQRVVESMITHPAIAEFMEQVAGPNYQLRADVVRRSTGKNDYVDDFQIPNNWHRDTAGEFTFGVFFDDLSAPHSGGTAVLPTTHWLPYSPYWDFVLSQQSFTSRAAYLAGRMITLPAWLIRHCHFNQWLKRRLKPQVVEINGRPGDIYFFLNDVWHGRAANLQGKQLVMVRFGGFPTDFPFKDDIALPEPLSGLAPEIARRYSRHQPVNPESGTLLQQMRQKRWHVDLFFWAWLEKQIVSQLLELHYAWKAFWNKKNV